MNASLETSLASKSNALSANVAETPASPKISVEGGRGMHDDKSDGEADRGLVEGAQAPIHDGRKDQDPARARCRRPETGGVSALLRREGLYSPYLPSWRKQRDAGQFGKTPRKRGPVAVAADPRDTKIAEPERSLRRAEARGDRYERLCELQKKYRSCSGSRSRPRARRSHDADRRGQLGDRRRRRDLSRPRSSAVRTANSSSPQLTPLGPSASCTASRTRHHCRPRSGSTSPPPISRNHLPINWTRLTRSRSAH
ncbi:MAG: hypothetical protein JWP01_2526 [Myxococcales bacterium]|nr:hypothetical protein [Myxococcales bacterium]